MGDSLVLEAKPNGSGITYLWSTGDTASKITITTGGVYSVVIDKDGCLQTATINILRQIKPATKNNSLGHYCILYWR